MRFQTIVITIAFLVLFSNTAFGKDVSTINQQSILNNRATVDTQNSLNPMEGLLWTDLTDLSPSSGIGVFRSAVIAGYGNFGGFFRPTGDGCSAYYNKGYCTDWVQTRTGRRQSGDAIKWTGNVPVNQGKIGDVVIVSLGKYGHVAVIEGLSYYPNTATLNGYIISEMNYGPRWINAACAVTDKFGVKTQRIILLPQIARIWRP